MAVNSVLQNSTLALAIPGVLIGHRVIATGDELALLPDEESAFTASVGKVRRASGAARIVARQLMAQMGHSPQAIPKSASGAPIWPKGLVGSLAHSSHVAVAALARRVDFSGLDFSGLGSAGSVDLSWTISIRRNRHHMMAKNTANSGQCSP